MVNPLPVDYSVVFGNMELGRTGWNITNAMEVKIKELLKHPGFYGTIGDRNLRPGEPR